MPVQLTKIIVLLLSSILASCANTSLIESWKKEELNQSYEHLMIIGISDSQQTRQIYEKYFVAELKKKGVRATPSYKFISSKQNIDRDTVIEVTQNTDIDSVLVTYLVSADVERKLRESPLNTSYSGSIESNQISATTISRRGQSRDEEVFVLKNDIYDVQSQSLVWSVKTKTVGPESIDQVIKETITLLIKELFSDGLLK
ncbi:MAG: hypothetical protein KAJ32_07330 [Gammaproteobacteria bacterium]|nr:hypothetical protein [Gammaproteobacteria bacterium]